MALNKTRLKTLLANTYDLSLKRKARRIIQEVDPKSRDKILEVGCGDGYYPSILTRLGDFFVVGLDLDQRALATAERNFKSLGLYYKMLKKWHTQRKKQAYFIKGDVKKMPFGNNSFNKIIMSEVLEHLPDDVAGLKEVYRVLAPRGTLILTVPNWYFPFFWDPVNWILQRPPINRPIKSGFWAGIWNQHERLYKPDEIKEVIEKAGFKIKKIEVQTAWCLPFNHYLINLGARALAHGVLPSELHSQANKFAEKPSKSQNFIIKVYYAIANFFDRMNKSYDKKIGTTIFIKATNNA